MPVNLVLFGVGQVGSTLIQQLQQLAPERSPFRLVFIGNSTCALFDVQGIGTNWSSRLDQEGVPYTREEVITFANTIGTRNTLSEQESSHWIAIDATASDEIIEDYIPLIEAGFHWVSANKKANTASLEFYKKLRSALREHSKSYFYETNVGAGLPVIDTIQRLHQSGESIQKIRGVFSGSLSFLFNKFSSEDKSFSEIVLEADALGLTEPDAREDLSGKDVARKLLILARELGLQSELEEVEVQSLVPKALNGQTTLQEFKHSIWQLDQELHQSKSTLGPEEVLRHVGELDVRQGTLKVQLVKEPKHTALGQTRGADAIFEIYATSYGELPLVIQGAGAGAAVTARGVLQDALRITEKVL
ncbi:aspartate kinase [Croceiramulus getboli]|nr:aspartate kinase [Flavobacteriaceae bacterium YJPT1-3]